MEKVRQTKRLRHAINFAERGDAAEFVVGLVDEHGGFFGAGQDTPDGVRRQPGAGGVVGVGDEDGAGGGGDGVEHGLQRELQVGLRVRDLDDFGSGDLGVEAVHGVGGSEDQDLLAVIDVGVDEDLDGFVGAVGEDEVVGGDAESSGR